jgi:hypothetical protein
MDGGRVAVLHQASAEFSGQVSVQPFVNIRVCKINRGLAQPITFAIQD